MVSLWNWIWPLPATSALEAAAGEVALRTTEALWSRVAAQITTMGEAEALGYTRAHALPLIERDLDEVLMEMRIAPALRDHVEEMTVDRLFDIAWQRACQQRGKQTRQAA